MQKGIVRAVFRGTVQTLGHIKSAINKQPVTGPIAVHKLGLEGDEQEAVHVHGGVDKAVHCYAFEHYATWQNELPQCSMLKTPSAFGENLSVEGLNEHNICIGDRWQVGSSILVVSQGRQPCFKLNVRFGVEDMAERAQNTLRSGWYFSVEQPGTLAAGDELILLSRPKEAYSVATLLAMIRDRITDPALIKPILQLPMASSWHRLFENRLQSQQVEDWTSRLRGKS